MPSYTPRIRRALPWIALSPGLAVIFVLIILPLAALLRFSFYRYDPLIVMRPAFVWDNYLHALSGGNRDAFLQTIAYGLVVTLSTLVLSYPVAYVLARMTSHWRRVFLAFTVLPLTLSVVVSTFGWVVILDQSGLVNRALLALRIIRAPLTLLFRPTTVIVALSSALMPYQVLALLGVISNIDRRLEEAAENLGANRARVLTHVLLPLSKPGMLAGSTFVYLETITAFVTPRIIGGGNVRMVGAIIYNQIYSTLNWPLAAALSFLLLLIALLSMVAFEALGRQQHIERERGRK